MPKIGNDIVDLNLAKTQSNWQRKGFLEKQFTKEEQQNINDSKNHFLKVWQFWSMKEAAYKCFTQKVAKRFFAPQKFECVLSSSETGVVIFDDQKFYTTTFFNEFYVHTIAVNLEARNINNKNNFLGVVDSNSLDKKLKLKLSEKTGFLPSAIEKRKTVLGVPFFYQKEKLITQSCSISHHGNYGAFVFIL